MFQVHVQLQAKVTVLVLPITLIHMATRKCAQLWLSRKLLLRLAIVIPFFDANFIRVDAWIMLMREPSPWKPVVTTFLSLE